MIESEETITLPWIVVWAFLRIATNPRIWDKPLSAEKAFAIVSEWLALPDLFAPLPGPRHLEILKKLVRDHNATGPLMTDAILAALAQECGARLASPDQGFSRFSGLKWENPLK